MCFQTVSMLKSRPIYVFIELVQLQHIQVKKESRSQLYAPKWNYSTRFIIKPNGARDDLCAYAAPSDPLSIERIFPIRVSRREYII